VERLGRALEYFSSGKYHECMLILSDLDEHYELNSRFRAFLGICYYYEWEYEKACSYLDEVLPLLQGVAPQERSLYYFANGESHFNLQQYEQAIIQYQEQLKLCHPDEKGDAYYRLGFCYMFLNEWALALEHFEQSLSFYQQYLNNEETKARITQIQKMIKGCKKRLIKRENH
jgi:tetratricopeptide (TPR) repeat protein